MVETWQIERPPSTTALSASAVALLLDAPQAPQPAAQMLGFLNGLVQVDYLSLVEYVDGPGHVAAPELVEGHARPGVANLTADCFSLYRRHFWRADEGTRIAQHLREAAGTAPVTALHVDAGDIPVDSWRTEIYDRAHLANRLSFFYAPLPRAAYAINLYRDRGRGGFGAGEIQRLLAVAPLLKQTHRGALCSRPQAVAALEERIARADATLARRVPELSARERAVCARIACGVSADGIAADLDVAPSTVITLRKRAYAKLAARGWAGGRLQLAELAR